MKQTQAKKENLLYRVIYTGLMAAMIFVATYFFKIEIATPAGPTMLKVGNVLCLLAGFLLGGLHGGLAAGIGSMLFDLLDPKYVSSAPFTLVFFFIMGASCGIISHSGKPSTARDIVAAIVGAGLYWLLNIGKSVILFMAAGSAFWPAVVANGTKMVTSLVNAVIAVVFSVLLAKPLRSALEKAGLLAKFRGE